MCRVPVYLKRCLSPAFVLPSREGAGLSKNSANCDGWRGYSIQEDSSQFQPWDFRALTTLGYSLRELGAAVMGN